MSGRSRQRSQRRAQIVMGIFAILVVLSMMVSLLWSFSTSTTPTTNTQPQPTVITVTPAP
jgi:flagellar basal body-associated protein FliL